MLERIHSIKTIGLLHDIAAHQFTLKKMNLIYANNGRGKSTLASIFRSYAENDPKLIIDRKTFGKTENQLIDFQFSNGRRTKFQNDSWDQMHTEMYVFDLDFVEKNVYTGGSVTATHRKNFLKFAIGKSAVQAQKDFSEAEADTIAKKSLMDSEKQKLSGYHSGQTTLQFINIKKDATIDDKIKNLGDKISAAGNIAAIKEKPNLNKIKKPNIDFIDFVTTLKTTVDQIDLEAEKKVKQHLEKHPQRGVESWINNGMVFIDNDECPMCGQKTDHLDLFNVYKSYFNREYKALSVKVGTLNAEINSRFSSTLISSIEQQSSECVAISGSWQEHIKNDFNSIDKDVLVSNLDKIRDEFIKLSLNKKQNPLDDTNDETIIALCESYKNKFLEIIDNFNLRVDARNKEIEDYKNTLEGFNLAELTEELRVLNKIKTRYTPEIISIIERYNTEKSKYDASSKKTAALKTSLETVMSTVLKEHEGSINKLLNDFGANFNIKEAHINYAGNGEAKSEYVLSMIGKDIPINANTSTFGTSLSEGDRRTLAFAFFMAVVLSDKDLDKKIVIIDDPMCSLDYNRKNQTTRTLLKLYKQSKQLFILAHDVFFIRGIRDSLNKANEEANYNILELSHIHGGYSNFRKIDLDIECESSYFKNHRILNSYISSGTPDKGLVAPCIRTMLEGYLHRRFPNILKKDCMFGEVVAQIVSAPETSPLHYAKNIVTELNEINLYAGQFHHDTKPDHPLGPINESELARFCKRALLVTYQ